MVTSIADIGTECLVPDCTRSASGARGMCRAHYLRVLRAEKGNKSQGDLLRPVGARQPCQVVGCTRVHSAHGYCQYHRRRFVEGFVPRKEISKPDPDPCKAYRCTSRDIKGLGYCARHYISYYRHGLSPLEHAWILEQQDFACAICRHEFEEDEKIHIDHDHACCSGGKSCGSCVRGLLCRGCNWGLGNFKDNPKALRAAADYVE